MASSTAGDHNRNTMDKSICRLPPSSVESVLNKIELSKPHDFFYTVATNYASGHEDPFQKCIFVIGVGSLVIVIVIVIVIVLVLVLVIVIVIVIVVIADSFWHSFGHFMHSPIINFAFPSVTSLAAITLSQIQRLKTWAKVMVLP